MRRPLHGDLPAAGSAPPSSSRPAAAAALDPLPAVTPLPAPYRYEVEFDATHPVAMTTAIPDV